MELTLKLNCQVQQLELYVVNYAYFLVCSAQRKMGKMQSLAQSQEPWSALGGFAVRGSGSVR